jgi:hypothetical protein
MEWKQDDVLEDLGTLRTVNTNGMLVEWDKAEISQSMGNIVIINNHDEFVDIKKLVDDLYQKYMGRVPEGTLLGKWQALVVKLGNVCYIRNWDSDNAVRMIEDVFKSQGLDICR